MTVESRTKQKENETGLNTSQKTQLQIILHALSGPDVVTDDQLRRVRRAMEALTTSPPHNIVSLNLCRSGWYITICCLCLLLAVSFLGVRSGTLLLVFVLAAYLSIGAVFGLIYYDYFLLDAGRYHLLLDTLFVENARDLAAAVEQGGREWDTFRLELDRFKLADHEKLLSLISSGYFASSVFAQDSPQVSIESDPPETVAEAFGCNYQFKEDESTIRSEQPLFYGHSSGVLLTSECARDVATNKLGYGGGGHEVQTNRSSSVRLANFICAEADEPIKKTERDYIVRVIGAADCTGGAVKNDQYSLDRARVAMVEARRVMNEVAIWVKAHRPGQSTSLREPVNIVRLRQAFMQPTHQNFAQRRSSAVAPCNAAEYDEILWPAAERGAAQTSDPELHAARAARVEVLRRSSDVTDRLYMQSGLTRNTTLSDMIYFSFVSFTTTGYGDIKAVSGPVRFCVIMENILEILFAAIFFTAAMTMVRQQE
ncbi:MAG: potassium channel family protein [Thermoanaerobaculia bacterium]